MAPELIIFELGDATQPRDSSSMATNPSAGSLARVESFNISDYPPMVSNSSASPATTEPSANTLSTSPTITSNSLTEPLKTFELFNDLPIEVRLEIWKMVPEPRLVEAKFSRNLSSPKCRFVADVPTLLHTCRESRLEALNCYRLKFNHRALAKNPVYFSNKSDILYIAREAKANQKQRFIQWNAEDLKAVERVYIAAHDFSHLFLRNPHRNFNLFAQLVQTPPFPGLKELTLVETRRWNCYQPSTISTPEKACFRTIDEFEGAELQAFQTKIRATKSYTAKYMTMVHDRVARGWVPGAGWSPVFCHKILCEGRIGEGRGIGNNLGNK